MRDLIAERGHQTVVIDSGILGEPAIEPTISRHEVAAAAETSIEALLAAGDKNNAISAMARGVT